MGGQVGRCTRRLAPIASCLPLTSGTEVTESCERLLRSLPLTTTSLFKPLLQHGTSWQLQTDSSAPWRTCARSPTAGIIFPSSILLLNPLDIQPFFLLLHIFTLFSVVFFAPSKAVLV